jgi:hypothetical protein
MVPEAVFRGFPEKTFRKLARTYRKIPTVSSCQFDRFLPEPSKSSDRNTTEPAVPFNLGPFKGEVVFINH